jgi:deoxyribonuclease IV
MPLFGAHLSIAGGLHNALTAARGYGMETVQLFTASPSQWSVTGATAADKSGKRSGKKIDQWIGKPVTDDAVDLFKKQLKATKLKFPTAHDSYLINLASPDEALYRKSIEAFVNELQRAEQLGLSYLVTHPGAHLESGEGAGLKRVAAAINETHRRCLGFKVKILLEATAGQGSTLGHRFEHLADIISQVDESRRLGVCLDTCHVFAAGYELAPRDKYESTMDEFDRIVGLSRLKLFHLNDSMKPLGSRVDRHQHLGKGCLGIEPFRLIVNDPRFGKLPMILETPKESDENPDMDTVNLGLLRAMMPESDRSN